MAGKQSFMKHAYPRGVPEENPLGPRWDRKWPFFARYANTDDSLQSIAEDNGISRERVRQLVAKVDRAIRLTAPHLRVYNQDTSQG